MLQINAQKFVHIGRVLQSLLGDLKGALAPHVLLNDPARGQFVAEMQGIKNDCELLKMTAVADMIGWILQDYSTNQHNYGQACATADYISTLFQQELNRRFFAYIEPDKATMVRGFENSISDPPFGIAVWQAFPHGLREMTLAGNGYAYGMHDACVFHLMRVVENGLAAMCRIFGIPFQFENWHTVIEQLEKQIRAIGPAFGTDWRDKQKFYSEVASGFMFIKAAWRNHVMHRRDEYDAERAKVIYDQVGVFMQRLAQGGLAE